MRKLGILLASAALVALSACATDGYGGGGYGGGPTTALGKCVQEALIGAGVGAVAGAVLSDKNRTENAAIGAVVGGGGTYLVCQLLGGQQQQATVQGAYISALNQDRGLSQSVRLADGRTGNLAVARPYSPPNSNPSCRTISATLEISGQPPQPLPQETYCRDAATGGWIARV
jgi:hypothetical protein